MAANDITPLRPIGGGVLAPDQVIGRAKNIELYWQTLKTRGFVLYAERRFGKSAILRKMCAEPQPGFLTIYKGVEGMRTAGDFTSSMLDYIKEHSLIKTALQKRIEDAFFTITTHVEEIEGVGLRKAERKWQKQLLYLLTELCKQHPEKIVVLMLDEFTIMLDEMEVEEASEVIGYLRDLAGTRFENRLRFVYCGSIGIDLVLAKLKRRGRNLGDPINHMEKHRLLPFEAEEAIYFARCLNLGTQLELADEALMEICQLCDRIPFFIDRLFIQLQQNADQRSDLPLALDLLLQDPTDHTNLKHFYDRIPNFYPNPLVSEAILTYLSGKSKAKAEATIAKNVLVLGDFSEHLIKVELDRLWRDGYLKRILKNSKRCYEFNYTIFKKWWKFNKG